MTTEHHGWLDLSWLADLVSPLGLKIDLLLEPQTADTNAPRLHYGDQLPTSRPIQILEDASSDANWLATLSATLDAQEWSCCMINAMTIPQRSLQYQIDGLGTSDGAALFAATLNSSRDGRIAAVILPTSVLVSESTAAFRGWLADKHQVTAIVYLGTSAAERMGVHLQFKVSLVVVRTGREHVDPTPILRLIDLREIANADWRKTVSAAFKRGGGEVAGSNVLRNPLLDQHPWTYERFSKGFANAREDARQLGSLRPLKDFVESFQVGIFRGGDIGAIDINENGSVPDGHTVCFGGRSISSKGQLQSPVCGVPSDRLSEDRMLRPGDVLVRTILTLKNARPFVLGAVVPRESLPATFDRSCIRIRFRSDLGRDVCELIVGYLNSTHTQNWLIANGAQMALNLALLERLEVPDPVPEVLAAIKSLAEAEQQYRRWADEMAETRRGIFSSVSLTQQLPVLLARQRTEIDRLRAARDAEGLEYQIRNYYPHPIALRWELIAQADPGKPRIDQVIDCAEHLLTLLAILALVQESSANVSTSPARTRLREFVRAGALHIDWGKAISLLKDGVNFTANHNNPLTLPFPELAELHEPILDEKSEWSTAERQLRNWRNKQAHKQRLPEPYLKDLSDSFREHLATLLRCASFVCGIPLVHVQDYRLNHLNSERSATFQLLQGISPVFQRTDRTVRSELARDTIGLLTRTGTFVSAHPWLIMDHCFVCKRPEIFILNRFEHRLPTYIAMETGHPYEAAKLAKSVAAELRTIAEYE